MKEFMTARERVLVALARKTPDRLPVFPVITRMHASRVVGRPLIDFALNPDLTYDSLLAAWREYSLDGFEVAIGSPRGWMDSVVTVERDGARCGGFILGSGDDIPRDTPGENVKAMVEAARLYGFYS